MEELPRSPADVEGVTDLHAARSLLWAFIARLAAAEEEAGRLRSALRHADETCAGEARRLSEAFDAARRHLESHAAQAEAALVRERAALEERAARLAERERELAQREAELKATKAKLQEEVERVVRQYRGT